MNENDIAMNTYNISRLLWSGFMSDKTGHVRSSLNYSRKSNSSNCLLYKQYVTVVCVYGLLYITWGVICKGKRQYLLTCKVSRYCLSPLRGRLVWYDAIQDSAYNHRLLRWRSRGEGHAADVVGVHFYPIISAIIGDQGKYWLYKSYGVRNKTEIKTIL